MSIPYVALPEARYGEAQQVAPLVRRVLAKNPSKYTAIGTGTYIVGRGEVAVIDPGPTIGSHREALAAALEGETVTAILVTHCHSDHSPLAAWLRERTGAPTVCVGPHVVDPTWVDDDDAPSETDPDEPPPEEEQGEEGHDLAFEPDRRVADGDLAASGDGWTMRAVHTPGHTSNHTCYYLEEQRALFTGDHIMGWSTSVITPPDGDMRSYLASLAKVQALDPATLWPTHGAPVTDVAPFVQAFIAHRLEREANVLAAVRDGEALIPDIVRRLYVGVPEKLYRAAGRSVLSHLIKLVQDGLVTFDGTQPGVKTPYSPT